MSLKVGQASHGVSAPSRQAALHHTGPTGLFKEVTAASASTAVGSEEQSLSYGEGWDLLDDQRRRRAAMGRQKPTFSAGVRFGNILTTEAVSGTLIEFRSTHGWRVPVFMRDGVHRYEVAVYAVNHRGDIRSGGMHADWRL